VTPLNHILGELVVTGHFMVNALFAAGVFPVTGGTGVTRVECTSALERDTLYHPAIGNGQMINGLWRPNQISQTRTDGSMLWIFQGSNLFTW